MEFCLTDEEPYGSLKMVLPGVPYKKSLGYEVIEGAKDASIVIPYAKIQNIMLPLLKPLVDLLIHVVTKLPYIILWNLVKLTLHLVPSGRLQNSLIRYTR